MIQGGSHYKNTLRRKTTTSQTNNVVCEELYNITYSNSKWIISLYLFLQLLLR